MASADPRPNVLASVSLADFAREIVRRVQGRLALLPDGRRWTWMDFAFAVIVGMLALSSTGFFTASYRISTADPDYFMHRLIAGMQVNRLDAIETGSVETSAETDCADACPLPVPQIRRGSDPKPADYEIVMVFGDEALLATAHELMRVKVGTVVPGLGRVLAIDSVDGSVSAEAARLRMTAR
ncbi:hypothetical protein [Aureimonas mangrovi]|uniref:hypothetical protein n=1 Tax=Aureimonas mangrovi TaxID=2758041 RepID=UPI00163DC42A|nr:hypothetical protein [Aureimonas mangrovi]